MNKRILGTYRNYVTLLLIALLASCANTAGKNYTLAKVNDKGYLTDPFTQVGKDWDQHIEEVNGNLEIRLADHFLAYLASLGQPELIIFSRATITDPNDRTKKIVYEQILLNTEDQATYSAGNQGGGGTLKDVVLLPSIKYRNQDIRLELRVIELDSEDNERAKSVINQAAQTGGTFKLVAGPEITAIAGALNFLVANNKDDVEFSVDIGISPKTPRQTASSGDLTDVVLQPRVGTWVIVKTELPGRLYFAGDTFSIASDALVWTLANAIKLGTLNVANWWNNDKDQADNYMRLFGNPLGLSSVAVTEPRMKDDKFRHVEGRFFTSCGYQFTDPTKEHAFPMMYHAGSVHVEYPCTSKDASGNVVSDPRLIPFRDKSYVALSFSSPVAAVDATALASLSDKIADLNIATTQLKGAEFDKELKAAMNAIETIAHVRNTLDTASEQMTKAQDAETISKAQSENYAALETKLDELDIDDAAKKRILTSTKIDLENAETLAKKNLNTEREQNAEQKMRESGIQLSTVNIDANVDPQTITMVTALTVNTIRFTQNGVVVATAVAQADRNAAGVFDLTLSGLSALKGEYELEFYTSTGVKKLPVYVSPKACTNPVDLDALRNALNADGGILNPDSHPSRSWQVCAASFKDCEIKLALGWKSNDQPNRTVAETQSFLNQELASRSINIYETQLTPKACD